MSPAEEAAGVRHPLLCWRDRRGAQGREGSSVSLHTVVSFPGLTLGTADGRTLPPTSWGEYWVAKETHGDCERKRKTKVGTQHLCTF